MFNRRFKKLKERRLGKYHGVGGTYDDVISCAAGGVACHYKSKSFAGVRFGSMVIGGAAVSQYLFQSTAFSTYLYTFISIKCSYLLNLNTFNCQETFFFFDCRL